MSSWTKSSVSLNNLHEIQKPLNDESGLGFSAGESSSEGTSTQSDLAYDKFKKKNFVKASVIHNTYEPVKYDDQSSGQLNQKGKADIGYIRPENSKPSWLKNRLEKNMAKAGSKSSVPNQSRHGAWLRPVSRGNRHFTVGGGRLRQSGPRPERRLLRQPTLEGLTRSARTDSPRQAFAEELSTAGHESQDEDTSAGGDPPVDKADEEIPWFVRPFILADRDTEKLFETASDSEDAMDFEVASQDLPVDIKAEEPEEKSVDEFIDADEAMSIEDIFMSIPAEVQLPSTGVEITKISFGKEIKIPGVNEKTCFLATLPQIPAVEEQFVLVKAEIELLVELREKVINEVEQFFHSFSRKKLAALQMEDFSAKVEQVLTWAGADSTIIALQRKRYILLVYREMLFRKVLEKRRKHFISRAENRDSSPCLVWKQPCCSGIFEGETRDRGAVIARSNTKTHSSCWIRTMKKVNGEWVIEPCADQWVKIPKPILSSEIPRQRQYDDTLPPVNNFFKTLTKRWADICLEVVEFCASKRFLPVGSLNFCRALEVVLPDLSFVSRPPTVFALSFSQFCTVYIQYSLFNRLTTSDITDFLSSIALERTVLRGVQSTIVSAVIPSVQLSLDQRKSTPTSADSSSSLNFDTTDLDATVSSLLSVPIDFSAALADFQAILSEQLNESQSGISSRLHKIDQGLRDSLREQAEVFKNLFQGARQEGRTIDDVQTLRFNEFRKNLLDQNASFSLAKRMFEMKVQE
ncbi:auxin response factor 19-like [Dorcoceras hygrometricum]|uniref:Auxin response factor 19-like n=1 Tax=Dorcoceras hygrometricum TaxID=472368 RepID=A0A2Z7B1M3_9LAMI|nr:auxin response factor 19-like [Dorcoceras hygrometricum]